VRKSAKLSCEWCGRTFDRPAKRGPAPKYCSVGHRQRAYEKRYYERTYALQPGDIPPWMKNVRAWNRGGIKVYVLKDRSEFDYGN
jgi:hypothetical protein